MFVTSPAAHKNDCASLPQGSLLTIPASDHTRPATRRVAGQLRAVSSTVDAEEYAPAILLTCKSQLSALSSTTRRPDSALHVVLLP